MIRRALLIIVVFGALALLLAAAGALLPVRHTAAVRLELTQPPAAVYAVVADVAGSAQWRTGLDSLHVLDAGPPLRWREFTSMGPIDFIRVDALPPRMVRARIEGAEEQGFGGTWTWNIVPRPEGGSVITITERGVVYNPLMRLFARLLFGPWRTLEQYARDLARRFGESAEPERVEQIP